MWMSSRVMFVSVNSNSNTICVPSAVCDGQQLKEMGKKSSLVEVSRHFTNGTGMPALYFLVSSLTSRTLLACDCLFKFGCTLYLNDWSCGASLKHTRSALLASSTVTRNSPTHSASPERPPSISSLAFTCSSTSTLTGSISGLTTAGATGCGATSSLLDSTGAGSVIPRPAKTSPGFFLPNIIPFFGALGLSGAGPESSTMLILMDMPVDMLDMPMSGEGLIDMLSCIEELLKEGIEVPGSFVCVSRRSFASSICFFFAISRASFSLLCLIISASFSS
mmetsp:Transcript_12478/g.20511  ORF Transcript_12478/g.20511 Transcript_12478/m.20511 type:complete len:278 (+) Transcript_12478:438-1271(+)